VRERQSNSWKLAYVVRTAPSRDVGARRGSGGRQQTTPERKSYARAPPSYCRPRSQSAAEAIVVAGRS